MLPPAMDKQHWETVDSDLAERISALIAERGETERRWVRVSPPAMHVLCLEADPRPTLSQKEKNDQQEAQEKAMMTALRTDRLDLKRRREQELRVIEEKKRRIEQNEVMQKQIAAALGSQCSQCSQG